MSCKKGGEVIVDLDCKGVGSATGIDAANNCDVIGNFDNFNLPEFLRGAWKNANKIVELDGIGPFLNNESKRTVLSLSTPTVHTVEIKLKGKKFTCDSHCPRYKECAQYAPTLLLSHIKLASWRNS